MDNQKISDIFQEIANMMEIKGENRFRTIAYSRGAQIVRSLGFNLNDVVLDNISKLREIPGIGQILSEKIAELVLTGQCEFHQQLRSEFPPGLLDMLRVRTVGPKKVQMFYGTLGIKNITELQKAAEEGRLRDLPKMGEKSEKEILAAILEYQAMPHERRSIHEAYLEAEKYVSYLKKFDGVARVQYAGSLRRGMETIGDVDILSSIEKFSEKKAEKVFAYFWEYPDISKVLSRGPTKSSVLLNSGIQVDLRVMEDSIFGAALHYFTGSKAHNIRIRDRAKKMGLKVNEYGVFEIHGEREILVSGKTEEDLFAKIGFPFIPPQLREDRGEVEWAQLGKAFPKLVELEDLRGNLHSHSEWSDGSEPLETVARGYMELGFEYIAMTDHSKAVGITQGLNDEKAQEYFQEIDCVQKKVGAKFRILKGSEVDILKNGSLDYSDKVLRQFDLLVASVHSHFKLPREEQTKRILKAVTSGKIHVLGHPTGRLINERTAIEYDMEAVMKACVDHHVALEINGSPSRMDLCDVHVKMGKDLGAKFVISTDSHNASHRQFLRYGILTAQRGWLTKEDVLNTMPLKKMMEYWKR
ncbi:MAG: DNA polymerase/3'-5' exonuclease PolX [Patescibacteria group bacterium]